MRKFEKIISILLVLLGFALCIIGKYSDDLYYVISGCTSILVGYIGIVSIENRIKAIQIEMIALSEDDEELDCDLCDCCAGVENTTFKDLFADFISGTPIKRKAWAGYWKYRYGAIEMHSKDGTITNFLGSKDIIFTLSGILQVDWEIATADNSSVMREEISRQDDEYECECYCKEAKTDPRYEGLADTLKNIYANVVATDITRNAVLSEDR